MALRRVLEVATHIVHVEPDQVTQTVWHKNEANALLHHLFNVAREASELNQALKQNSLGKFVALNPVDSWCQFGKDGPRLLQHNVVDGGLPLCELAIDREGNGHIGAVVME